MSNFLTILKQIKLIGLIILATSVAHGQNQSAFLKQFATQAFVIPEKLVQMKKLSVGNLDLKSLIEEMKTLTWSENGGTFLAGSGDSRTGAVYDLEKKIIILNSGRAQFEPKSTMSIAALHEALGGLGYEDENYQLSLLLRIQTLSDLERNTIFKDENLQKEYAPFFNLARRSSNVHYLMAGGGTSVGGGGDGIVVQIKWYLLMFAPRICELSNLKCNDILHRLLHTTIEINPHVLETAVRTERLPSKNIIRVPMINWLNGNIRTGESSLNDDQLRILQQIVIQVDQL